MSENNKKRFIGILDSYVIIRDCKAVTAATYDERTHLLHKTSLLKKKKIFLVSN